jgi:hypothetical protein
VSQRWIADRSGEQFRCALAALLQDAQSAETVRETPWRAVGVGRIRFSLFCADCMTAMFHQTLFDHRSVVSTG